jgi:hypothetical protein
VLDEYKQTPRGSSITYVDLQGNRVVIGFSSGNKVSAGPDSAPAEPPPSVATSSPAASPKETNSNNATRRSSQNSSLSNNDQKATKGKANRDQKPGTVRVPLR